MDRIREAKLRIYNIGDIRISGRKLDEIFDYDGVSVLWMVKEKILHDGFKLPYWNINRNLERWSSGESYGGLERLKKIAYLRAARIAIQQAMARRKGRDIKVLKADVLLFTYTNQIRTVDGKAEVFRLEGLRKGISNNLVCSILPVTMKENVRGEGGIAAAD